MDPMQLTLAKSTDESLRALAQIKEPDCALLYACIYAACILFLTAAVITLRGIQPAKPREI